MMEFIRRLGKKIQELLDKIFGKKNKKPQSPDVSDETWESLKSIFGDGEINCGWVEIPSQPEMQKNFFNIPLTLLPKRIPCRAIILSLAANQQSDYQAVDMSQYEERRIAHLIIGRACGLEELMCEYISQEERLDEEDIEWMKEEVARCKESGLFSALIPNATLLHYEALGVWDFEEDE